MGKRVIVVCISFSMYILPGGSAWPLVGTQSCIVIQSFPGDAIKTSELSFRSLTAWLSYCVWFVAVFFCLAVMRAA